RHIFCLYTILPQPTTYTLSLHDALPICFNRLLNAADSIFNSTMADFIGTTIPYNPFGDYRVPIPSNQPLIDFATIHARDLNTSRSEEHTSELQSPYDIVCRLLLEKKNTI